MNENTNRSHIEREGRAIETVTVLPEDAHEYSTDQGWQHQLDVWKREYYWT